MKPVITATTRQQVADLSERMIQTVSDSTMHRNAISRILTKRYGKQYYENAVAIEYFDKHGNNDGGLVGCAQMLEALLAQAPSEATDGKIAKYINLIGRWDSDVSDKPQTPDETKQDASKRTLRALEDFVAGHNGDFGDPELWDNLQCHIEGFRQCQRDMTAHAGQARKLSATIMPGGMVKAATL